MHSKGSTWPGIVPPRLRAAANALLAAALCSTPLYGQVEDLGSQAQGIVDQMHALAASTPQYGTGGVAVPSSSGGTTITYTPNVSAAAQRQFYQQEQRIQMIQQRQQLMISGAQFAGQVAGQLLAQAIFGSPGDEQARLAEQARQQQAAEQLHQAQVQRAAQMRIDWDGRDAAMSDELAEVFSAPSAKSTPAFGIEDSTNPSDRPDPGNGTNFFGIGSQEGAPPDSESSPVVAGDSNQPPVLAPEYVSAQQSEASGSIDGLAWAHLPDAVPAETPSVWRQQLTEKLEDYGKDYAIDKAKKSSIYASKANGLTYVPGYDWAVKAKSAYDYGKNLKGQFDALEHPLEAVNNRTIMAFENGASGAVDTMSNIHSSGSEFSDDYWQRVQQAGTDYDETALSLIKKRIKTALSAANKQDEAILAGSD